MQPRSLALKFTCLVTLCLSLPVFVFSQKEVKKLSTLTKDNNYHLAAKASALKSWRQLSGAQDIIREEGLNEPFHNQWLSKIDRYIPLDEAQIRAAALSDEDWDKWMQALEKELGIGTLASSDSLGHLILDEKKLYLMSQEDNIFVELGDKEESGVFVKKDSSINLEDMPLSSGDVFYAILTKKNQAKHAEKIK
ncbi:MAG: hypothetical protein GWP59_03450 [Chlamydiales bacterium]|nr:hypothetical protein [Chlamydiales bacterium]NCF70741.1 hypothetical protein [Chlamydiales bacterium]